MLEQVFMQATVTVVPVVQIVSDLGKEKIRNWTQTWEVKVSEQRAMIARGFNASWWSREGEMKG